MGDLSINHVILLTDPSRDRGSGLGRCVRADKTAHMTPDLRQASSPTVIPDLHQGSKSEFGGEVDIEQAIDRSGCSAEYYRLEECLGEHDRDWRKCQRQVSEGILRRLMKFALYKHPFAS